MTSVELNVIDHDRDSAGLRYVYPVVSRRAGGVSVGINLNTNNACNWRCIYCQVPDLKLGAAPPVNLTLLEIELRGFLDDLLHGDFMQHRVPADSRRINDIALSGNGEPTSANEFLQVIDLIELIMKEHDLHSRIKLILITNGSLMHRANVQAGLRKMAQVSGEVWFKLDRASELGMQHINNTQTSMEKVYKSLTTSINLCPTWLQTCWFTVDSVSPGRQDEDDYLNMLERLKSENILPKGVLLYTLARPSMQAEASRLSALSAQQMELFAERIRDFGVTVNVSI